MKSRELMDDQIQTSALWDLYFSFFFSFFFFRAIPVAHGGSQARGQMGATASSLDHSHSNVESQPHLRPTPQLKAMPDP